MAVTEVAQPTPAEAYAATMTSAFGVRPAPCAYNGNNVGVVLDNGGLQVLPATLTPVQARGLMRWIETNFGKTNP